MAKDTDALHDLSRSVYLGAREAAFALMKANYSERPAPELGEGAKVHGVEPQARDVAIRLRESIWYRFDALRFHHHLVSKVHDGYVRALVDAGPAGVRDHGIDMTYGAVLKEQAIFDSIVFHSTSLFDYLGNSIWFGFHGSNFVKKKWKNTARAARDPEFERKTTRGDVRLNGSETGRAVVAAHESFVADLAEYRAKLFHYKVDSASGGVTQSFQTIPGEKNRSECTPELRISLPEDYVQTVRGLTGSDVTENSETILVTGAEALITRVGETTNDLLRKLTADLGWDGEEGLAILS